ncbi:hypothetical protein OQJ02_01225 [Legionella sp. PATHC032]|uniref:hypothetical protein n=1 Tax=Legionella sp. PATHC032 TaxID=2992039 RepID=UPI001B16148A|nr:hypothetical protein [Legionella sp. PATHC032]MCW8420258.1 hypothetical protein [Legionella sp. PATHC032]HAZ7573001.1 hypothetical protein [Legionella pneumophila]HBA1635982.1 hypothetical protein [Legionella pneumophila]
MRYTNIELLKRIPQHLKGVMEYYPDVLLFQLNQIQYTHLWHELASAKYLYTNGYEIKPTHWLMYAFQTVKGWFGFDNHCQPEKVSYVLNKLSYYGYTKQFLQPDFSSMRNYSMSPEISALVVNSRDDLTTAQLQNKLVNNYFKVEPYLGINYSYQKLNPNHRFGESWLHAREWGLIPQLDPQDDSLIAEVISTLDKNGISAKDLFFLQHSKYTKAAAQYYCDKAKNTIVPSFFFRLLWVDPRPRYLALALAYDPEIAKRDTQKFIEYHLGQKEYDNAFNLLGILNDSNLVLKFLLAIPEKERHALIQKDTAIAAIMAKYYTEKKQYLLATQFYSNIEEINPNAAFAIEIQEQNYEKAYDIFKKYKSSDLFSTPERKSLAKVFFSEAETTYVAGKTYRGNKNWEKAKQYYLQSLEQKKAAYHLDPSDEYLEDLYAHKRLYALLLIDADIDLNKAEDSDIASIQKAITLLRECHSNNKEEQEHHKRALATGLMRRVDTLREKIAFNYYSSDFNSIRKHKIQHQQDIAILIKTLEELIALLQGTQDKALRLQLGKAHYLLADVQCFFDINAPNINQHYKMAMKAVPGNPFYVLRVAELFEEEKNKLQKIGITQLKNMGYQVFDFLHWSEERWCKRDDIIHNVKDIHVPPSEPINNSSWNFTF